MARVKIGPAGMDDWRVQDDLQTLLRAKEIERDSKRMGAVRKLAQSKIKDMESTFGEEKDDAPKKK